MLTRDAIVDGVNYSPRIGMSVSVLPEGRGILRGGFGKFAERTPLNVGAFTKYDMQTVTRFAPDGIAARRTRHVRARHRRCAEDAREHGADGGLGPALRPARVRQGRLPAPQRGRTRTRSIRIRPAAC